MPGRSTHTSRRTADRQRTQSGFRNQPTDWYQSSTTHLPEGETYYYPPEPITLETLNAMSNGQIPPRVIDRLPNPEPGSKPPAAWDEWEKNKNWPFPANWPEHLLNKMRRKKAPKLSSTNSRENQVPQEEIERNANWPFPSRKRTTSQASQAAPRLRTLSNSKPRERTHSNTKNNAPVPVDAPLSAVQPEVPFYMSKVPLRDPNATIISPLLARDSIGLVSFDLRLPYTSVRKLVRGPHWTHLNHDDLKQPAATPHRIQMRIYTQVTGTTDWIADVRPRSRPYVTVEDVLMTVCDTFNVPLDHRQWARDSVNPKLWDRVRRAYDRRVEKFESTRTIGYETTRKAGVLRVDYLGSKYAFAGISLCYGGDGSEWFLMEVSREGK